MTQLFSRKLEFHVCKIASTTFFSTTRLDLSIAEASHLKKLIADVVAQYEEDFKDVPQPSFGTADASDRLPADKIPTVTMDEVPLNTISYKEDLKKYEETTTDHKKRKIDDYIIDNAKLIIDDGSDLSKRKRKLAALPVMSEKRRKLFVKDSMIGQPIGWETVKTKHQSMFDPVRPKIDEEVMDPIFEVYRRLKPDGDDRKSDDHVALVVPGPPPMN